MSPFASASTELTNLLVLFGASIGLREPEAREQERGNGGCGGQSEIQNFHYATECPFPAGGGEEEPQGNDGFLSQQAGQPNQWWGGCTGGSMGFTEQVGPKACLPCVSASWHNRSTTECKEELGEEGQGEATYVQDVHALAEAVV